MINTVCLKFSLAFGLPEFHLNNIPRSNHFTVGESGHPSIKLIAAQCNELSGPQFSQKKFCFLRSKHSFTTINATGARSGFSVCSIRKNRPCYLNTELIMIRQIVFLEKKKIIILSNYKRESDRIFNCEFTIDLVANK